MVKDYSVANKVGNRTRLARVMQDLLYLHLVKAGRRFMYLLSPFFAWFQKERDASVLLESEVRTIV